MINKYKMLIPLMIAGAMGTVDSSVVNVAMPTLANIFEVEMQTVSWVSSSYLLVLTSFLLTAGRLGDMYGYKKPFEWGLLIMTFGSVFCGLAPSLPFLIATRVIQAIGSSLIMSSVPAMVASYFPPEQRGKAMGMYVVSVSIGLGLGPSLGGMILSKLIWRYIFFINVPLGITALIISKAFIPIYTEKKEIAFDYLGTVLALLFLASLLLYINQGSSIGWLSNVGLALIIISIVSLAAFIIQEKKSKEPMLELSIFKNKAFTAGLASNFMYFLAQIIMAFLTPFLLTAANCPTELMGLVVLAFPLAMIVFAPIGGYLSDRINPNKISALGGIFAALSVFLIGILQPSFSFKAVSIRMLIFGIGGGFFETSNSVVVLSNSPEHRRGIASGVLAMVRNAGMVFGVAISSALTTLRQEHYSKILLPLINQQRDIVGISGIKDVFLLATVCALVCSVISIIGSTYTKTKNRMPIEKGSIR